MSDVLDYELDDVVHLDTPERLRAMADPVRSLVLDLVLERAMSVSELSTRVAKSKGTVAHHVDVLVDAGLLKVVRTRKVRALEERFYGRTARTIVFPTHDGDLLPFFADAEAEVDRVRLTDDSVPSGFTLRHARIPTERAAEWLERFQALALEFSREPRGGDIEYAVLVGFFPTNRPVVPRRRRTGGGR